MATFWPIFEKILNNTKYKSAIHITNDKINSTNEKLKKLGLKSYFKLEELGFILKVNINTEDSLLFKDPKFFYKFLVEVYFEYGVFDYNPRLFKINEGLNYLNYHLEEYEIPYTVRVTKDKKVHLYSFGPEITY
jgi:hypothetical protein